MKMDVKADIKKDIEEFLQRTGISCYKLCKEAQVSKTIVYYLLQDKRRWMLNRTEQKLREAMCRLSGDSDD